MQEEDGYVWTVNVRPSRYTARRRSDLALQMMSIGETVELRLSPDKQWIRAYLQPISEMA